MKKIVINALIAFYLVDEDFFILQLSGTMLSTVFKKSNLETFASTSNISTCHWFLLIARIFTAQTGKV